MFCAVENKLSQTNRPIMYTRAVTFKALCSMGTYGKPVEYRLLHRGPEFLDGEVVKSVLPTGSQVILMQHTTARLQG